MSVTLQNQAVLCIQDTLRRLLDESVESREGIAVEKTPAERAFAIGRAEALAESLHTWSNQLQTFGLNSELNGIWTELQEFLRRNGL